MPEGIGGGRKWMACGKIRREVRSIVRVKRMLGPGRIRNVAIVFGDWSGGKK